jgi:cell wall-associated NlpC family hydrolase
VGKAVGAVGVVVMLPILLIVVMLGGASGSQAATTGLPGLASELRPGSVPAAYLALVQAAGAICQAAPAPIIAAQIDVESGWNPDAVSPSGAEGISQFLPSTWPHWSSPGQSPFDPTAAIPAQARYDCAIAGQLAGPQKHGQLGAASLTELMLAGYNAGPAAILSAHGIPAIPETQQYVSSIIAKAATYAASPPISGGIGPAMVHFALTQIGVPYSWDGGSYTGPTLGVCAPGPAAGDCGIVGWDCSGLIMAAAFYASAGRIQLPHSADLQAQAGTKVTLTPADPISQLHVGDLIAFTNHGEAVAHHIGLYAGGGQMIDAPESGSFIRLDSLSSAYYQSQIWTVVRL